jgi:hypothetical protein
MSGSRPTKPARSGWVAAVAAVLTLAVAPQLWADLAPREGSGPTQEQLERRREFLARRAAALASTFASASAAVSALPAPSGSAEPALKLRDELAKKLAELKATRAERRARHRSALVEQLGARLNVPEIKAELELHARREAELARVTFLARNARSGAAREQLLARAAKLSEREQARHTARMQQLASAGAAPSAGASPAPPSASPPGAPSARPRPRPAGSAEAPR